MDKIISTLSQAVTDNGLFAVLAVMIVIASVYGVRQGFLWMSDKWDKLNTATLHRLEDRIIGLEKKFDECDRERNELRILVESQTLRIFEANARANVLSKMVDDLLERGANETPH